MKTQFTAGIALGIGAYIGVAIMLLMSMCVDANSQTPPKQGPSVTPPVISIPIACIEASEIPVDVVDHTIVSGTDGGVRWSKMKQHNGHYVLGFWLPGGGIFCPVDQGRENPDA